MTIQPFKGEFTTDQKMHLLRRTLFGVKKSDLDFFNNKTLEETVDFLLKPTHQALNPTPPLKNYFNPADNPDPEVKKGETWVYTFDNSLANGRRKAAFKAWWMGLMLQQDRSILEKMVLFWHNHFPIDMDDRSAIMAFIYNRTLRDNALGNFKTFVKAITLDPMMLRYLNGAANNALGADENYARELFELFTLGKGKDSQYTEDDVKAAAKVLTGYQITIQVPNQPFQAVFVPERHDTTDKRFSSFFKNKTIKGRQDTEGVKELDDLLDMIFEQPEVARFICRKLYRFFVYHTLDETVEKEVITPLAEILRTQNYDITPVLKTLFTSAHFYEPVYKGCIIKSPVDYVASLGRSFEVAFPSIVLNDFDSVQNVYATWYNFHVADTNGVAAQRQNLADPPNVAGWSAYYQEPFYYRSWIDTETYPKRVKFAETFIDSDNNGKINIVKLSSGFKHIAEPKMWIEEALAFFYAVPVSAAFKDRLRKTLLSGQMEDRYWTEAWRTYSDNPSDTTLFNTVYTRLKAFYRLLILKPEFHLH